jgi:hypothetical protein
MRTGFGPCSLTDLPPEVLLHICHFLSTPDLGRLAQTCRTLRDLVDDDGVWRPLVLQYSKGKESVRFII